MPYANPYEPVAVAVAVDQTADRATGTTQHSRWPMIGFVLFAAVPVVMGIWRLCLESAAESALPPGTVRCGMGGLAGVLMIIFLGPLCGLVGALITWGIVHSD